MEQLILEVLDGLINVTGDGFIHLSSAGLELIRPSGVFGFYFGKD